MLSILKQYKGLLIESLDKDSYSDWESGLYPDSGLYRDWYSKNYELGRKLWGTQAGIYDEYFLPIDNQEEFNNLVNNRPNFNNRVADVAFDMFSLFKQDVLNGKEIEESIKR